MYALHTYVHIFFIFNINFSLKIVKWFFTAKEYKLISESGFEDPTN